VTDWVKVLFDDTADKDVAWKHRLGDILDHPTDGSLLRTQSRAENLHAEILPQIRSGDMIVFGLGFGTIPRQFYAGSSGNRTGRPKRFPDTYPHITAEFWFSLDHHT
jgi:hypothetical protein